MSELKTKPTDASWETFIASIEDERKRADSLAIIRMMAEITGEEPVMWGESMIGFGSYHYTYATGREGDWFLTGFAPRKQALTLYIMAGFTAYENLLAKLGKHKKGKGCLYIKRLSDVDESVLRELIRQSVEQMRSGDESSF